MSLRGDEYGAFEEMFFGDGSDGDVTVSSSLSISRDMFYNNLDIATSIVFYTNGHKIRVKDTLRVNADDLSFAFISNNGFNARNSTGEASEISGGAIPAGTLAGVRGTTGGGGIGGAGMYNGGRNLGNTLHVAESGSSFFIPAVDIPSSKEFMLGGAGGRGADAFSGTYGRTDFYVYAGDLGATGSAPAAFGNMNNFFASLSAGAIGFNNQSAVSGSYNTGSFKVVTGGAGGGAGACMNSGTVGIKPRSGWGGGGGGVVYVAARDAIVNGKITANGGNGGNTFAKAGGGGGGGGGFIYFVYGKLTTRNSEQNHFIVNGGLPGIGQTLPMSSSVVVSTTASQTGATGSYLLYNI